jgi:hypothetical protein
MELASGARFFGACSTRVTDGAAKAAKEANEERISRAREQSFGMHSIWFKYS